MKRILFFATLLLFSATFDAGARDRNEPRVVTNPYPKVPPRPKAPPFDYQQYSILPREWRKPVPPDLRSEACKRDVLVCVAEDIYSTPNAEFRKITKDTSDRPHTVGAPLSYAAHLQKYLSVGLRAGKNNCAKGVRLILEAARLIPRNVQPPLIPQPPEARLYYPFLAQFGFIHDWGACRRPGAIRIYGGVIRPIASRMRTAGDSAGHIEIVTLDGKFMSFYSDDTPAHEDKGEWRRPLIACMIKKTPFSLYPARGSK